MDRQTKLKTTMLDFHSQASRLMRATPESFNTDLHKFIAYIEKAPFVSDYLQKCVTESLPEAFDAKAEVDAVSASFGAIFGPFDESDEGEVAEIYLLLKEISERDISGQGLFFYGYSCGSKKYRDMLKGFLDRVPYLLISHINDYLPKEGMLSNPKAPTQQFVFHTSSSQLNFANQGSVISPVQNVGVNVDEFTDILSKILSLSQSLDSDDREIVEDSVQVLSEEIPSESPRKGMVKTALGALKGINGGAQFAAAVAQISEFVSNLNM